MYRYGHFVRNKQAGGRAGGRAGWRADWNDQICCLLDWDWCERGVFQANYPQLCSTILDVISSIYHQDNANYFIVEPQNTLSQFAEKIHTKSVAVRVSSS